MESATPETEQSYAESPIVSEDVSKRGENEKHFLCEDGSYIAVAYADAVHEKNEQDEWIEIDNTLALENNRIENNSDNFRISFSETANPAADLSPNADGLLNNSTADDSESQLVSMESGEHRLSWSLSATSMLNLSQKQELSRQGIVLEMQETSSLTAEQMDGFIGALPAKQLYQHSLSALSEAEIQENILPENPTNDDIINNLKASSSVIYQNALGNDVDLQYTVNPGRIKEDIIINERGTFVSYTMNLDTDGLTAVLNDDNSVSFLNTENQVCFTISVPYMYDSADTESYDIDVDVIQNGNNCTVTFTPDTDWLNDSARVYPVTIDPDVIDPLYTEQTTDFYSDTYVVDGDTASHGTEVKMYCGYRSGKKNRAYLRITKMPVGLPLASQITGVTLIVPCLTGTTSSKPFSLYQVNGSWDESSLKWSNQPAETLLESGINRGSDNIVRFSSTNLKDYVCKYYANVNNNYGFSIRYTTETDNDYNSFYTKENGNSGGRPKLKITYYPPANIADGTYYVRNKHSGHYLDAANSGGAGANVSQYGFHGATNQQWIFKKQTANNTFKGYYRISPGYNTNLYLDVANGNAANSTNIQVYTRTESNAQHWTIIDNGNGTYRLMSKASSNRKCATVQNASTSSGANVFQYQYNGSGNDEWYLDQYKVYTNSNTSANAGYDRNAAKNYANTYAESPNTEYKELEKDCTNFASQCLHSGGLSMIAGEQEDINAWRVNKVLLIFQEFSYTWSKADYLAQHWGHIRGNGNQRAYRTIEFINAQALLDNWDYFYSNAYNGDVIQIVDTQKNTVDHSMVVNNQSATTSSGHTDILYAQHTPNKKDQSMYNKMVEYRNQGVQKKILLHRIKS